MRVRNSQKPKLGSPQPRLAKPAAKRGPSRAVKGKKPLAAKTQQKRARHAALTPTNAWHSARDACLRDRRETGLLARFRATQTSVVDADARTASRAKAHELASNAGRTSADEKNAPPHPATALRQRLCGNQNFTPHEIVLHAIDATLARWRGDVGSSPLDGEPARCTRRTG